MKKPNKSFFDTATGWLISAIVVVAVSQSMIWISSEPAYNRGYNKGYVDGVLETMKATHNE